MPLDPNIILQAGQGVTPLQNPMDAMGKALQLKGLMQQQAKQQQEFQDAADFRAKHGVSAGMAQAEQKLALGGLENQKAQHDAATAHLQAVSALNQQQLSTYQAALDTIDKDPTQAPAVHAAVLQKTAQNAKTLFPQIDTTKTDDPPAFQSVDQQKAWLQSKIAQSMTAEQRFKTVQQTIDQQKVDADNWQLTPVQGGFALMNKKTGEMKAAEGGFKPIPNQTQLMVGGGQLSPEAMAMLVQKYKDTGQLDADIGRNPALRAQIVNAAAKDGPVDLAKAKIQFGTAKQAQDYFTKGRGADAFRQQETILHHADVFTGIADALQNGNVQAANKLGNAVGIQFGSDQATNYKIAGQILSAEVGKYLAGGQSTEAERRELAELIPSFSSPQQMKQGLATLKALVEGQRQSWTVQRDAALKGQVPTYASDKGAQPAKTMSLADAKATAAASGKTLDQVIAAAKAKGWEVK